MIWVEIALGMLLGGVSVWLVRLFFRDREIRFWQIGLIAAAFIYVLFVLFQTAWSGLWLELGGLAFFCLLAWLSTKYSLYILAMGWSLHIAWDQILHPGGFPGYVPEWYPGICLGFDIVIALFLIYLAQNQNKEVRNRV